MLCLELYMCNAFRIQKKDPAYSKEVYILTIFTVICLNLIARYVLSLVGGA